MNAIIGRMSLRFVITAVFAALLVVMAAVTWFLTFRNARGSVEALAEQVGRLTMVDIRQNIDHYLSVPRLVIEINSFAFGQDLPQAVTRGALARRFAAELKQFDSVVSIAYANEKGDYVGMSRATEGIPLALGVSGPSTGGRLVGYRSDYQGRQFEEFDQSVGPFDARERPWYSTAIAADGLAWTPVYMWVTGDAGIDLVAPVRDRSGRLRGVLDASLTLSGIGKFLGAIRATPHSQSFIMERSGALVAASSIEIPYRRSGETLHRFSGADIEDPSIREGARTIMSALASGDSFETERQFRLRAGSAYSVMRVARVHGGPGLDWYFAELIPESDFAQHVYDDMRTTAVFVLLFLLASMAVALVLARRISAPLKLLTRMARSLAAGGPDVTIEARGTGEVVQLAQSFNSMAADLRRSFDSLQGSEARYRAFVSNSDAGIFRLEAAEPIPVSLPEDERLERFYRQFFLAECNDTAVRMVGGRSADELQGRGPDLFLPHLDRTCLAGVRDILRSPHKASEFEYVRRDGEGTSRSLLTTISAVVESGFLVRVWGVFRDLSDRRAAEEALRRSEARLRRIFDRSAVSLWEADISELHTALESLKESGVEDLEGYLRDNPQFVAEALRKIRIVDVNQTTLDLLEARSREELLGPLNVAFEPAALSSLLPAAMARAKDPVPHDIETTVRTRTGKTLNVIIHFYIPAEDDILKNMLVSVVDITKRTQAEREREELQDQLRHSQKVETIGRLAGGISHDINNLLTPILAGAELLVLDRESAGASPEALEQILGAARRIKDLTRKLLAFSRKQDLSWEVVHLGTVISDFQKLLRRTLRKNIDIRFAEAGDTGLVRVDVGQIERVLMNLAVNAQDAMPGGGTLSIDLRNAPPPPSARPPGASAEDSFVLLTVTDTGTGMETAVRDHLFEPFFTTKEEGHGTGLGLSTVYGIVKQHGGHIMVDTEPGRGTTFCVFLPRHARS
jgi:signal transduction histidine kinase/HAMP domain-containing protein